MIHPIRIMENKYTNYALSDLLIYILHSSPRRLIRRFFRRQRRFIRRMRRRQKFGQLLRPNVSKQPRRFRRTSLFPNAPYFETIKIQC
jgi:hypothetical protein